MELTSRIHIALIKFMDDHDIDATMEEILEIIGYGYKYPVGTHVIDPYGNIGVVYACYSSWETLKEKNHFVTIDPDNESDKMDFAEKIINGDPKDKWLGMQEMPFSDDELNQPWYSVCMDSGGAIWCCEGRLKNK